MSLTELHLKLIELDRKKAEVKKFYEDYANALEELTKEFGVGHHFQDDQGIVYQIVEQDGKWVTFDRLAVDRTKRPNEDRGSLSVKKAKELGYSVE
jgi:poly-beta-hydroxyalkanoate depolymerase